MPAKPRVENIQVDSNSDLTEALSWSISNSGDVDAEIHFDESGASAPLPAKTSMNFDFIGDRYSGKVYVVFEPGAEATAKKRVTIIKTLFFCTVR
jgi:hypothetical protein